MNTIPSGALPRRGLRFVAVIAVLVLTALGAWVAGQRVQDPIDENRSLDDELPPLTVAVEERTLRETLVARGAVGWAKNLELKMTSAPGVEGSVPAITSLPELGAEIGEGGRLIEVSFRPVFILAGDQPAVRDLGLGVEGQDVVQLQASLVRLGLLSTYRDGRFDAATQRAVRKLYENAGYEPPAAAGGSAPAATSEGAGASVSFTGAYMPMSEMKFVADLPARVSSIAAEVGDDPTSLEKILTLGSGVQVATLSVSPTDARALAVGQLAEIVDDAAGVSAAGTVASVSDMVGADDGLIAVAVELAELNDSLLGRAVRVSIDVGGATKEALVVPAGAVFTNAAGVSSVEVLGLDGVAHRVVVEPGFEADGLIEVGPVEHDALAVGDRVLVGDV